MARVSDYFRFATLLLGVGYIVLWPLTAFDHDAPFGAALICAWSLLAFLCRFPHPLTLPPGLQLIGLLSAACLCLRLAWWVIVRERRAWTIRASRAAALNARIPAAVLRPARRKPLAPSHQVKPRRYFGLRGRPH
jgi:hypothetical protein